jgi:hypothetical protein
MYIEKNLDESWLKIVMKFSVMGLQKPMRMFCQSLTVIQAMCVLNKSQI